MPGTTLQGLPYPLPTEPVAEGAAAIRSLAEAVDVWPHSACANGVVTFTAADQSPRIYTPSLAVDWNTLGGSPFANGFFQAPSAGRYLLRFSFMDCTAGSVGIAMLLNDVNVLSRESGTVITGSGSAVGGISTGRMVALAAGSSVKCHAWNSGPGGIARLVIDALRLG